MKRIFSCCGILAAFSLLTVSCISVEDFQVEESDVETGAGMMCPDEYGTPCLISARFDEETDADGTKTSLLQNGNVLWEAGDRFSLLYSDGNARRADLLTYSSISSMKIGESKTVMITSTSYDGSTFGSSSNTWDCVRIDRNGAYNERGTGISTAASDANQIRLGADILALALGDDSERYFFTLTRGSSGYTIKNKDGYYIYANNNTLTLNNSRSTSLAISQPANTTATSTVVKQNTSSSIVNQSLLRFSYVSGKINKNTKYNLFNGNNGPTFSTETGGWSFFYLYEVSGETGAFNQPFTLISGANTASADFSGNKDAGYDDYVALYPYSSSNSFDGETISFDFPSSQTYRPDSFAPGANVSAGLLDESGHVSFKNLLGTLRLTLSGSHTIYSITLKDLGGKMLWGRASLLLTSLKDASYCFSLSKGSSSLTLDCGSGVVLDADNPTDFYISVPPGALASGFSVVFRTSAGELSRTARADNTIHRAMIRKMPHMGDDALRVAYSIENDVVADYMANVNYTDSQFDNGQTLWATGNYTDKAKASSVAPDTDQPNPITITWTSSASGNAVASLYSDAACTMLVQSGTVSASAGRFSFHSLLPDRTYYYQVTGNSGVIATGYFDTVGQLRMIKLDGGWNVRDMGGWTCLGGKKFPYETVYRGGMLEYCTSDEQLFLYNLGIRSELELRGNQYDKDHGISKYHNIGIGSFSVDHTMIWNGNNDVVYYQNCSDYAEDDIMLTTTGHNEDAYIMNMAFIMDVLMNREKPLYFHCKSGADRTGMTAFFIEALLGFSKCDIIKDYELTSFNADDQGLGGRTWSSTCRPMNAYNKLMAMSVPAGVSTLQQRVYYYLNHYWPRRINASDIDSFIMYMLDMTEEEYAPYRPQYQGKYENPSNTLQSIYAK